MNNFFIRTLTAGAFVAILLGCTFYGQLSFSILFLVITILGLLEFYSLVEKANAKPLKIIGTAIGALFFAANSAVCMNVFKYQMLLIFIPIIFLVFIIELFLKKENPFANIAFTILGILYVALPFSLLNYILTYSGNYSYQLLFGVFFILWSNDSGAYLAGVTMGKHKIFPRVSPKKSWEGSIGGTIASFIVAYIISGWYTSIQFVDWMIIAAILVVMGTLGDFVESLFKRSVDIKDSGNILPGHGGILDRFDSLIMAIPFVFTYLYLMKYLA